MASIVQYVTGSASDTTSGVLGLTFADPTGAGNTGVVFLGAIASLAVPSAASCTLGGSADNFAVAASLVSGGTSLIAAWADPGCAGGQTAIAASSGPSGGTYSAGAAYEISGLAASPADQAGTASGTGTSWDITTGDTTQAAEIWLGAALANGSTAITGPASPWANVTGVVVSPDPPMAMIAGYRTASATGTAAYAGTANAPEGPPDWLTVAITLKDAPPAGGLLLASFP